MAYATSFLVSLIAAVLVVIVMVLVGEYTKTGGRWLLTALVLAAYFFFSLGPVSLAQRRPDSRVWRVALAVGVAALLLLMTGIWGTPNSDAFWKIAAIVTALGLVLIYFAVVELQQGTLARQFAIKVAAVGAAMVCLGIAVEIKWPPYWWVFTLLVFVWLGAILAPPVIGLARRIQGR
ncbi:MAG: hypothetical protein HQ475_05525 [SAR202 cluster bacterium]|nr:hypothetical protein [SAR202 cluster bacterium]